MSTQRFPNLLDESVLFEFVLQRAESCLVSTFSLNLRHQRRKDIDPNPVFLQLPDLHVPYFCIASPYVDLLPTSPTSPYHHDLPITRPTMGFWLTALPPPPTPNQTRKLKKKYPDLKTKNECWYDADYLEELEAAQLWNIKNFPEVDWNFSCLDLMRDLLEDAGMSGAGTPFFLTLQTHHSFPNGLVLLGKLWCVWSVTPTYPSFCRWVKLLIFLFHFYSLGQFKKSPECK